MGSKQPHHSVCVCVCIDEPVLTFLMQNWNAYIGRLGRNDFCFNASKDEKDGLVVRDIVKDDILRGVKDVYTVGVMINFTINRTILPSRTKSKKLTENQPNLFLYGRFAGSNFTTQIKGNLKVLYTTLYM